MHHRGADFLFGRLARPFVELRIGQRIEPLAYAPGGEKPRQPACRFHDGGESAVE